MAQELEGSGLHIFVSQKQLSSTCHVSFLAATDTDHKFSLTCLIYFSYLSDSLISTHKINGPRPIFTVRWFHCRVADQHKSHLLQVMNDMVRHHQVMRVASLLQLFVAPSHQGRAAATVCRGM